MAMILQQAVIPERGSLCTSSQMASLAEAINSRILQGAGDCHWRIPYYIFSAFFRKPRLDDGSAYSPENEFFDYYQFINPISEDYFWPTASPQTPEGANLQTNTINKFIFGMNYGLKDEEDGAYIFDREDVRASKAQENLNGGTSMFAGYTFSYFTEVGLGDIDPDYTAFNFARDYLSNGYLNGSIVNPAGHSYGGYYGKIPQVSDGNGCGVDEETGKQFAQSTEVLYQIDSSAKKTYYTCPEGVADPNKSYYVIQNKSDVFNIINIKGDQVSLVETLDKNKYHPQQYVSKVYLQREVKNNLLRVLYNYISFAKGFDFDWFFKNQYAYAPELGSLGLATVYVNDDNQIVDFKSIVNQKRLIFQKLNLDSNSGTQTLLISNMTSMADASNNTIDTDAKFLFRSAKAPNNLVEPEITGTNNILTLLSSFGFLHVLPSQVPVKIYSFPNSRDSLLIPKGFTFQRFVITSTNLKKFTIKITFFEGFGSVTGENATVQEYVFDNSLQETQPGFQANNPISRNQTINGFFTGGATSVKFEITGIQFFIDSIGSINLSPVFLYSYKPKIEDAYALLRAATYFGINDAAFDRRDHPFNGANFVEDWNPNLLRIDYVPFCKRLSNDLKRYGFIQPSNIVNAGVVKHTNNNPELNSNAVFEALRRMSLYSRILKPDNFIGFHDASTLKFNRYILQKYTWGKLANTSTSNSITRRVPYSKYTNFSNSYAGGSEQSYLTAPELQIPVSNLKIRIFDLLKIAFDDAIPTKILKTSNNDPSITETVDFFNTAGKITTDVSQILTNPNFLCDYYSSANIYDFSELARVDIYRDLQIDIVKGLGVQSLTQTPVTFSPLSYYCPYDFIVFDATSGYSSFIYCRFQDSFGRNWGNTLGVDDHFISVKKYYVNRGVFTEFEFLGVSNSQAQNLGAVLNSDLSKIGVSSVNPRIVVIALKRNLDIVKGFDQNSIGNGFLNLDTQFNDNGNLEVSNAKANYFYLSKNGEPLLANISSSGFSDSITQKFVTANIINYPIKYNDSQGFGTTFDLPFSKIDTNNTVPYSIPLTGSENFCCGPILNFSSTGVTVTNFTLTGGNKYTVSGGKIEFNNVIYIEDDVFIAPASGTYTSYSGSPVVTEFKGKIAKVFDLTLNNSRFYEDKSSIDVNNPLDERQDISLTAILNKFLQSYNFQGIDLNEETGNFYKKTDSPDFNFPRSYPSLNYDQYNKYLAGLSVKLSYLGSELIYENDSNYDEITKYKQLNGRPVEDLKFWIAKYNSSNNEVSGSKQFFNYNDRVILPSLAEGEYLRFSVPVNNLYKESTTIFQDVTATKQLYKNNLYQLSGGKIKITIGGVDTIYETSPSGDPIVFSPTDSVVYTDHDGTTPTVYRLVAGIPYFFQKGIYLSILNYFYLNDILSFYEAVKRDNYLEIELTGQNWVENEGTTTLRDAFQGIAVDPDGVGTNSLYFGQRYYVKTGSINHAGINYSAGQSFTAVFRTYTKNDNETVVVLPVDGNGDAEGIIEFAKPEGYSNEWVLWMNFLPYSAAAASEFKEDVYAATGSPFYDRCHINSVGIPKSQENSHLNLGQELARYVEAPPSYRYMPLLNSKGQIFYTNVIGADQSDLVNETKRTKFYSSCKAIQQPYLIQKAYFKVNEPNTVYIKLNREIDGWNDASLSKERTDYNGLFDWLDKGTGSGKVNFRIGDASLTNQNGLNQITSHSSNGYKGSYYPRFFFLKLIPRPYFDDGNTATAFDSYMNHEHLKQAELYISAMREGFAITNSILATTSCEYLDGHLTPPDYTYEHLFFYSGSFGTDGGFKAYGNKWPPLVTFSKVYNTVDQAQGLSGPERNNDNPRGFGALPRMGTYGEFFSSIGKAINQLTSFRVSVPQNYFAQYNFYYRASSEAGNTANWNLKTTSAGKNIYIKNSSSPASVSPPLVLSYERNLRKNDGFLESVGINMGYSVDVLGASTEAKNIANAYTIENRTTATINVKPIDSVLLNNAYGSIKDYLNTSIAIPISYQSASTAGVYQPSKETVINDGCGFYILDGPNKSSIYSQQIPYKPSCEITRNLTLEPPNLIAATPYFGLFFPTPCSTTTVQRGTETIDKTAGGLVGPLNFNSASSTNAQIWEVGWRIITPITRNYIGG